VWTDADELFNALARSKFRSRFRLSARDRDYQLERGAEVIAAHARDLVRKRLAPAAPRNDGKQTPYRGHPVFVAQHATGTCCRGCLQTWHALQRGRELTEDEQAYVVDVLMTWLQRQSA
jgi:hypothetical protein